MNNIITPSLTQMLVQAPVLLVYLLGLILAFVFWRRCPTPSLLVVAAIGLLLLVTVTQPFVTQYLIQARTEIGWTHEKLGWVFSTLAVTSSCVRAAAVGLLLAAVFLQRRISQPAGPNAETSGK